MEIVSEPEIRSPDEAKDYLQRLRNILVLLEVCDGNMEEGSFRCDANISLRPAGQSELGVKVELKNMNSFQNVKKGLEHEIRRQNRVLDEGGKVIQETRLFNPDRGITESMRTKEEAHDYRYFPDPDLVPLVPDPELIMKMKSGLPELPESRRMRYIEVGLTLTDADLLSSVASLGNYFDAVVKNGVEPRKAAKWILGEVLREMNATGGTAADFIVNPSMLAGLIGAIDSGRISGRMAKDVFADMVSTGKSADLVIKDKGLVRMDDEDRVKDIVLSVIRDNPGPVEQYRGGKEKTFGFFVGQVMRATRGQADPAIVNRLLRELLKAK